MEEVYDLGQYTYCLIVHLSGTDAYIELYGVSKKIIPAKLTSLRKKTCIYYNNEKTNEVDYDSMNGLYHVFKKDKNTCDENDKSLTKKISDFLSLQAKKLMGYPELKDQSPHSLHSSLHYAFIVPSEWEEEIREDLIRPIFIQANLISKDDHKDRLLFISDIESICYRKSGLFKRNQNTIIFRLTPSYPDTALLKVDLINTTNALFDIPNSDLFPRVISSNSFSITSDDIKNCVKLFLTDGLFPKSKGSKQEKAINIITRAVYANIRIFMEDMEDMDNMSDMDDIDDIDDMDDTDDIDNNYYRRRFRKKVKKDEVDEHKDDDYYAIDDEDDEDEDDDEDDEDEDEDDMDEDEDDYATNDEDDDYYAYDDEDNKNDEDTENDEDEDDEDDEDKDDTYKFCEDKLMEPIFINTNYFRLSYSQKRFLKSIRPFDICAIASKIYFKGVENILSNQFTKRYKFLIVEDRYSSLVTLDSRTNIWLICMLAYNVLHLRKNRFNLTRIKLFSNNVSVKHIIYGTRNAIKKAIQNSNIHCPPRIIPAKNDVASPSIFLKSSPEAIINIDISLKSTLLSYSLLTNDGFAKETQDHGYFTADNYLPSLEKLNNFSSITVPLNLKEHQHNKYIKAFLFEYLCCIKEVLSRKLLKRPEFSVKSIKIGYAITIEKMVLDNIFNGEDNLQELIYESGLIEKDNNDKKLRIITQGEGVLSVIQQSFKFEFPVKSWFVLAQLHEDYIRLTMNQVVTASSLEDKQQEAIIVEDKNIPIQNIYFTLCLNMWNNLIENNTLIQLCAFHSRDGNENNSFELFSLKTKEEFTNNFKKYILENILAANVDLKNFSKINIKMNSTCDCEVCLTVDDIVEISFKPLLKDISCVMLTPLINKKHFAAYTNIKYHFSMIHFNHNIQFQDIIGGIIKDETSLFNPVRGIDTLCMIIPKLLNQFSLPLLPFLYKGFQIGTLYPIFDKNYEILLFEHTEIQNVKTRRFLKEVDKIGCTEINELFQYNGFNPNFKLARYQFKIVGSSNGRPTSKWDDTLQLHFHSSEIEYRTDTIPFMITIKFLAYSFTIQLSIKLVGKDTDKSRTIEIGNPITLYRY